MVSNQKNKTKKSDSHEHNHPEPITYFKVAMALVALTALEVVVFYFEWLGYAIIPVMAILSIGKLKSQYASMISKPLFIIVAESIVILEPISQFG